MISRSCMFAGAVTLFACGSSPSRIVDYRTNNAPLRATGQRRPSLAGFVLGESFGSAGLRCREHQLSFRLSATQRVGYCEQPIQPIGYAIAGDGVHLRRCADEKVCLVAIQISRVGESQLQAAIQDLDASLEDLYGTASNLDVADPECASALSTGHYACLLYGNARLVRRRNIDGGAVELRVEGADGAETALVTITLASDDGWQAVVNRDL